jgi:hypothetical protein
MSPGACTVLVWPRRALGALQAPASLKGPVAVVQSDGRGWLGSFDSRGWLVVAASNAAVMWPATVIASVLLSLLILPSKNGRGR